MKIKTAIKAIVAAIAGLAFGLLLAMGCCAPESQVIDDRRGPDVTIKTHMLSGPTQTQEVVTVTLEGEVTQGSGDAVAQAIMRAPKDAIVILVIDSYGGDLASARRVSRALEERGAICLVDGQGYSAAYFILQSCRLRLMTPRSSLLVHKASVYIPPVVEEAMKTIKLLDATNASMVPQNCLRLKIPLPDCVAKYENEDWVMVWQEATAVGAVEGVVMNEQEILLSLGTQVE